MLDQKFLVAVAGVSLLVLGFFGVGQYVGQASLLNQTASISNTQAVTLTSEQGSQLQKILNGLVVSTTKPVDDCGYLNESIQDMTRLYNSCMSDYNKACPPNGNTTVAHERACDARYRVCGNILNTILELEDQYRQCQGIKSNQTEVLH